MTTICPFETPPRGTSSMAPMAPFKHPPGYPKSSPVFIGSNPPVTPQSSHVAKTPVDSEKGGAWWVGSPICTKQLYHANSPIGSVRKQLFPTTEKKESLVEIIAMQAHDELTESVVKRALGDNYY